MSDDRPFLNGHAEPESLPADLAAVEQRLTRDGAVWQQEMPATTRLAAYVNTRAPRDVAARSPVMPHKGHRFMETETKPVLETASMPPARSWPRRVVAVAMAAFIVVFAIAILALHAGTSTTGPGSGVPGTTTTNTPLPLVTPTAVASTSTIGGGVIVSPVPGVTTPITWIATAPTALAVTGDMTIPAGVNYKFTPDQTVVAIIKLNGTAKSGDAVTAQWFLNGKDVTGQGQQAVRIANPPPSVVYLSLQNLEVGQGEVKIAYNGVVAYAATFFVLTPTTPPALTPTPAPAGGQTTPTPVSGGLPPPSCTMSLQSDGPTPTPSPCKKP